MIVSSNKESKQEKWHFWTFHNIMVMIIEIPDK
jgi:hypothetical protein